MQKAEVEAAKARKLVSEADSIDLDFLMKDQGVSEAQKVAEMEAKRLHELDKIALNSMLKPKGESR